MRNVLLMLSTKQPPHPELEIQHHADSSRVGATTWVVTTRTLTGLVPGASTVAFYGDRALNNRFLGRGTFVSYAPLGSALGEDRLRDSQLYRLYSKPSSANGMIESSDVTLAGPDEGIDVLGGIIVSTGKSHGLPLALENLPNSASRAQVYYLTRDP